MPAEASPFQVLLALPPRMAEEFEALTERHPPRWFAGPEAGYPIGNGGGTARLLAQAWAANDPATRFRDWLGTTRRLLLLTGDSNARLPASALTGAPLLPLPGGGPVAGNSSAAVLLDQQLPAYQRLFAHAGTEFAVLIARGDAWLRCDGELPPFPAVDMLALPGAGAWLMSFRAVQTLMERCGWDEAKRRFPAGVNCELATEFGAAFAGSLVCASVALPRAQLFPFRTNRELIESAGVLFHSAGGESPAEPVAGARRLDRIVQNSRVEIPQTGEAPRSIWIENSFLGPQWQLAHEHVLTGVPENHWALALEPGVCLDFVPVGPRDFCLRAYGFDDPLAGALGDPQTRWFGRPVTEWFAARNLQPRDCALDLAMDFHYCPLFPARKPEELDAAFVAWVCASHPPVRPNFSQQWRDWSRLSARQLGARVNVSRLFAQRAEVGGERGQFPPAPRMCP